MPAYEVIGVLVPAEYSLDRIKDESATSIAWRAPRSNRAQILA